MTQTTMRDSREQEPKPPFPEQPQRTPGLESQMQPKPDYGEESYKGSGRLAGKAALIAGGDSGIGRGVRVPGLAGVELHHGRGYRRDRRRAAGVNGIYRWAAAA